LRDKVIPDTIVLWGSDRVRYRRKIVQAYEGALGGKRICGRGGSKRTWRSIQEQASGGGHK
jgi:hypothetical protein